MYGPYYNRVMTYEYTALNPSSAPPYNVEYNFGTCDEKCPADYVDSSYAILQTQEDVPSCPSTSDIGKTDDARLLVLYSVGIAGEIEGSGDECTEWRRFDP
jgi:hypothetical protein